MIKYIIKRIFEAIPVMFAIITAVFFMVRFVPGGPFDRERSASAETIAALNGWTVNEIRAEKAAVSLELGCAALVAAALMGVLLGLAAAAFGRSAWGAILSGLSLLGICLPSFVLGPLLILLLAIKFRCFNAVGWDSASDIVLPALTLALFYAAWIARLMRRAVSDELSRGYVRTARAKGLPPGKVYFVHIFKNAVQPVVSYLGPAAAGLLTGSFVVETIFQIPG